MSLCLPARRHVCHALGALALIALLSIPSSAEAQTSVCSRVAARSGSDTAAGTEAQPFRSAQRLVDSLSPGQSGCLRAGGYAQSVSITRGGSSGQPVMLRSYPGEKVTLTGRLVVKKGADFVVVEDLWLDGRNAGTLPSPTVNAHDVVFRHNDVTNEHTAICFVLGASNVDSSAAYGRAPSTVIESNRIHDCGKLPATNHDHGIYVEGTDDARIHGNWIYDNADRGIQLYPDAQRTVVTGNVLDSNGTNIVFSGDLGLASSNTTVRGNLITQAKLRFNIESWYPAGNPKGTNNQVTANCVHGSARTDYGSAGINTADGGFTASANTSVAPGYVDAAARDYRLAPGSPCRSLYSGDPTALPGPRLAAPAAPPPPPPPPDPTQPAPLPPSTSPPETTRPRKRPKRVSLAVAARTARAVKVRHGRSLDLVGAVGGALDAQRVLVQVAHNGGWRTVAVARLDQSGRFSVSWRVRARRGAAWLRLRALAPGVGSSRALRVGLARR